MEQLPNEILEMIFQYRTASPCTILPVCRPWREALFTRNRVRPGIYPNPSTLSQDLCIHDTPYQAPGMAINVSQSSSESAKLHPTICHSPDIRSSTPSRTQQNGTRHAK
ncbi:hypothetical protein M422DRAFT_276040 [Sphaerobolus stellatus SS14]|uniref:F-box domain-containing protein n=1 Tax=Sphaerobolus stellatus (strain SS14) TaxID=990650 RepID=A0A0C9TNG4_SPHS4|nr:hypothetical protein M422DRAFT_276040 [Sphaerobolus stellatus SS14]